MRQRENAAKKHYCPAADEEHIAKTKLQTLQVDFGQPLF